MGVSHHLGGHCRSPGKLGFKRLKKDLEATKSRCYHYEWISLSGSWAGKRLHNQVG